MENYNPSDCSLESLMPPLLTVESFLVFLLSLLKLLPLGFPSPRLLKIPCFVFLFSAMLFTGLATLEAIFSESYACPPENPDGKDLPNNATCTPKGGFSLPSLGYAALILPTFPMIVITSFLFILHDNPSLETPDVESHGDSLLEHSPGETKEDMADKDDSKDSSQDLLIRARSNPIDIPPGRNTHPRSRGPYNHQTLVAGRRGSTVDFTSRTPTI